MKSIQNRNRRQPVAWDVKYVQRRVMEITCEQFGCSREQLTLDSCLGEIIGVDSLDIVEYVLELETEFAICLTDDVLQRWFPELPVSMRRLAEVVLELSNAGGNGPPCRRLTPAPLPAVQSALVTQRGGILSPSEWLAGPLHEPLGVNREGCRQYRRRTDGMRCVLAPEAEAWIGSRDPLGHPVQRPGHTVRLSAFLIDAEPVSNRAFARFLNSVGPIPQAVLREWCLCEVKDRREPYFPLRRGWWTGWRPIAGTELQPAILVTWHGANAYSLWANRRDWRRYRGDGSLPAELRDRGVRAGPPPEDWLGSFLPSEAQWEYAARGANPRTYPWGDEPPTPDRLRVARHAPGAAYTAATLPAARVSDLLGMSPFGLHHMAGNVWQWCRDWYAPDFYYRPEAVQSDAQNERPSGIRCERGGSWVGPEELACSSYRRGRPPEACGRCLGFRCVGRIPDPV